MPNNNAATRKLTCA